VARDAGCSAGHLTLVINISGSCLPGFVHLQQFFIALDVALDLFSKINRDHFCAPEKRAPAGVAVGAPMTAFFQLSVYEPAPPSC
jgi:hypothetical protein